MASIYQSIEILSKEKGIEPHIVLDAVKDAMLVAARKHFRTEEDLVAELDERTGAIQIYAVRKVVAAVEDPVREITLSEALDVDPNAEQGSEIRIPKSMEALGRISAQTAKQVILQKVREAERENIYTEYSGRVGELVNCTVKRIEGQDLIMDLGKTEARLPKKEQSRLESFSVGERVRCVMRSVEKTGKNAGVIVSRAAPEFVMRLFEQEVPEIYDNTVVIKGCAREAGERTKIAVFSRDRDVDSVGACVGMKGMRVQSIIRELRGEKIDIIEYSEDPVVFATHALSPAKISRVSIVNPSERHMEVIVDDSQLSLAIGKKGQNVRLAAKLLGWKVDIKSEEEKRQEVESQMAALGVSGAPVSVLIDHGLGESIVEKLVEGGVGTVERLGAMTPEQLEEIAGIGPKLIEKIQSAVVAYYGQFEEPAFEGDEEAAQMDAALQFEVEVAPDEAGVGGMEPTADEEESVSEAVASADLAEEVTEAPPAPATESESGEGQAESGPEDGQEVEFDTIRDSD
ncbi:MAG: transcription termination/antitermination protein NusA [Bryobacteraceae bacterium]|nr:transcription termination factor NusA [Bryobacterales bacterium]MEB2363473.1 transcription termination factor NusA [Bryobacterales bacterium]NUN02548.1 transcription termination/antitermination protein NusA [Bryobacteraceae bacterium]